MYLERERLVIMCSRVSESTQLVINKCKLQEHTATTASCQHVYRRTDDKQMECIKRIVEPMSLVLTADSQFIYKGAAVCGL